MASGSGYWSLWASCSGSTSALARSALEGAAGDDGHTRQRQAREGAGSARPPTQRRSHGHVGSAYEAPVAPRPEDLPITLVVRPQGAAAERATAAGPRPDPQGADSYGGIAPEDRPEREPALGRDRSAVRARAHQAREPRPMGSRMTFQSHGAPGEHDGRPEQGAFPPVSPRPSRSARARLAPAAGAVTPTLSRPLLHGGGAERCQRS